MQGDCVYVPCPTPVSLCGCCCCLVVWQVRHVDAGKDTPRLWQQRPLTNELITCAAADVAYLIPLMETQVCPDKRIGVCVCVVMVGGWSGWCVVVGGDECGLTIGLPSRHSIAASPCVTRHASAKRRPVICYPSL